MRAQEKLMKLDPTDVGQDGVFKIDESRLRTVAMQLAGALLWITQTRLDLNFEISVLSPSMISALRGSALFRSWLDSANKITEKCKTQERYLDFRLPNGYQPSDGSDDARSSRMFLFVDAIYASLLDTSSMGSFVLSIEKVRSRNGDIDAFGNVIDFGPKKFYRASERSLSSEVAALSNGIDIGILARSLADELLTGAFLRDLVDARNSYSASSPFGLSPCEEDTLKEINLHGSPLGPLVKADAQPEPVIREHTSGGNLPSLVKSASRWLSGRY